MIQQKIQIVYIKTKYIEYLYKFDKKVMYNKGQKRPYIGVLFEIKGHKYYAPLTHPKEKFKNMKNNVDFIKFDGGRLGAVNLNNMIPVKNNVIINIDVSSIEDQKYKLLLIEQIEYINKHNIDIISKASKLYNRYTENKLPIQIKNRCCNFTLLETHAKLYKEQVI